MLSEFSHSTFNSLGVTPVVGRNCGGTDKAEISETNIRPTLAKNYEGVRGAVSIEILFDCALCICLMWIKTTLISLD